MPNTRVISLEGTITTCRSGRPLHETDQTGSKLMSGQKETKGQKKRVQKGVTGKRVGEVMHVVTAQVYRHNPRGHTMDDREAGGGNETMVVPGLGLVQIHSL